MFRSKKALTVIMVIVFLVAALIPTINVSAATLVWSDEFNGTSLDTSKWNYDIGTGSGGWGNNELEYYTNRTNNVNVTGGNLVITALNESYGGMNYTSGRIHTKGKYSFTYGTIEARIKIPTGQGIWPAFWMLGSNIDSVGWPACGEQDVMEHVNNNPNTNGTIHWDAGGHASYGLTSQNLDFNQFHTYDIVWDTNAIKWYVDGNKYCEANIAGGINSTEEFQRPFFILLNLAVGGQWPGNPDGSTVFPNQMLVDYVRVYNGDAVTGGGGGGGNPNPGTPYFMIVNRNSGKCLDLIGGDTTSGARINQWAYDYNSANQRWAVLPTGDGHFKIISYVSGKSMSVVYGSLENEAQIHDWDYLGNPDQKWDFIDAGNGWYKIRNVNSGKMLDVAWASLDNDAKVQQNNDNGHPAEQWRLQPWGDYNIKTTYGKYVCVENMGSTNGSRIIQYDYENNPWFKWRFENVGDGWYKVSSLNAITRCIDVKDVSTAPAAITHLWDYVGGSNQKVSILPKTNGTFQFFFQHDGMAWDIPSGQTGNNVPLTQYPYNGWPNQEFTMERVQ